MTKYNKKAISFLLLHNKFPQNLAAKNNELLFHGFCGSGIWMWLSLVPWLQSPMGKQTSCPQGLQSAQAWTGAGDLLPSSFTRDLTGLSSSPCGLPHRSPYYMTAGFSQGQQSKRPPQLEATLIYDLIIKVTFYHFCCIPFIRNRIRWCDPQLLRGGSYKSMNIKK